jgi:hypothetical protein
MSDRPLCEVCGKPEATGDDEDSDALCWAEWTGGGHSRQSVLEVLRATRRERDAARAELLEMDARLAGLQSLPTAHPDLDAIEAAVRAKGVWAAPWSARRFAIECPCPRGVHCGELHTCWEVEAREEYPHGAPGEPADEGDGQCVVQIEVPGLEDFAAPTAAAIVAMRNGIEGLLAAARERDALRARLASLPVAELVAYGRAREDRVGADLADFNDALWRQTDAAKALLKAAAERWREWCDEGRGGERGGGT